MQILFELANSEIHSKSIFALEEYHQLQPWAYAALRGHLQAQRTCYTVNDPNRVCCVLDDVDLHIIFQDLLGEVYVSIQIDSTGTVISRNFFETYTQALREAANIVLIDADEPTI